jgi:hypothetical protein
MDGPAAGSCGCSDRRSSWTPGRFAAGVSLEHDDSCAAAAARGPQRMTCPSCARVFPYARGEPACLSEFVAHVNACEDDPAGVDPAPPAVAPYAALFRVRLHARVAALGPPAAGGGWPTPDASVASSTPSTRAIVVKHGPWYSLRAGDADEVASTTRGVRVLLGSEAASRAPAWLAATRVRAIVNCAFNSEPLDAGALAAAGVADGVARVRLVDAADVDGQDAAGMIRAGADALAVAAGRAVAGDAVLVHCVAGVSRSAAVVAAWLVIHERRTLRDAVSAVRVARPVAMPNVGFWRALRGIEAGEREGASSVPEDALEALHPRSDYPVSTHVWGAAERS